MMNKIEINKIILYILNAIYFISPWVCALEYEHQRFFLFTIVSLSLAIMLAVTTENEIKKYIIDDRIIIIFWIFFLYLIITTNIFDLTISKNQSNKTILTGYLYTFILIIFSLAVREKEQVRKIAKIIIITGFLNVVYSMLNYYTNGQFILIKQEGPWIIDWNIQIGGTFSYKNLYASYLTLTLYIAMATFSGINSNKISLVNKIIKYIVIFTLAFGIFKTSSRGALLANLIVMIYFFMSLYHDKRNISSAIIKKIAISISLLIGIMIHSNVWDRIEENGFSANGRDLMHNTVINTLRNEGFYFGTGIGTYELIQEKYKQPELGFSGVSKRAHNDYLEQLVNMGIIGYFVLLFIIYITLLIKKNKKKAHHLESKLLRMGLLYIIIHSSFDFNLESPIIIIILIFYIHALRIGINEEN